MTIYTTLILSWSILWLIADFDSAEPIHNLPTKLLAPKERVNWEEDRLDLRRLSICILIGYTFFCLMVNYYFYTILKKWSLQGKAGYDEFDY